MTKIAFLDRDGTLNVEVDYLYKWSDFKWIEGAKDSLVYLKKKDFILVVITNQSGIARSFYKEKDVEKLHQEMNKDLNDSHGIEIDHFIFCPHHPDFTGECDCRKPNTSMFEKMIQQYPRISLENSLMIGDNTSDMEAGKKLNLKNYLVRTGHGKKAERMIDLNHLKVIDSIQDISHYE